MDFISLPLEGGGFCEAKDGRSCLPLEGGGPLAVEGVASCNFSIGFIRRGGVAPPAVYRFNVFIAGGDTPPLHKYI